MVLITGADLLDLERVAIEGRKGGGREEWREGKGEYDRKPLMLLNKAALKKKQVCTPGA